MVGSVFLNLTFCFGTSDFYSCKWNANEKEQVKKYIRDQPTGCNFLEPSKLRRIYFSRWPLTLLLAVFRAALVISGLIIMAVLETWLRRMSDPTNLPKLLTKCTINGNQIRDAGEV